MTSNAANAFRERAHHEAERYGSDPWVFVRELLQNARDAGAHRVWFETSSTDGRDRISCRDDGSGMRFEHAQRYLFSLYASSKRGRSRTAGRFGIGFWSVLRFEPDEIVVRSRVHRGEPWQVRLDGHLEVVRREKATWHRGTEVVLERPASAEDLDRSVGSAVLRDAPFLRCRHRAEHPVEVRVNGRLMRSAPALPPPSLSFRSRGVRGVVGFGPVPRAEIFAHGLRVRDAPTLDELLVEAHSDRPALTGAFEGLAPRVIIDSRDLQVLMARGDAREDRALRRLVAVGHREMSRLVRTELDRHAGLSPGGRLVERLREAWSASGMPKMITAVSVAAALAFAAWMGKPAQWSNRSDRPASAGPAASVEPSPLVPYQDLWGRYRGPDVDSVGNAAPNVDLSYRPSDGVRFFDALWVTGLGRDGQLEGDPQRIIGPYVGAPCADGCLEVELGVDSPAGLLRLPVVTGHLLDPQSIRLDGLQLPVVAVATGQPAVRFDRPRSGRLRYRSAPGVNDEDVNTGTWPPLPSDVAEYVHGIEASSPAIRASRTAAFIRRRIVYDTSAKTAARHHEARRRSISLFDRALAIGAGDCDVQNSLVAAMLAYSGLPSRLAVGWIGADGRARNGLHAWAEYRDTDGRWRAIDASAGDTGLAPDGITVPGAGAASESARRQKLMWALAVLAATLVLAALAIVGGGRLKRRRFRAGHAEDIVGLLRGAAVRPGAFEDIHSLFSRRALRLLSGSSISLSRARERAKKSLLACGSGRSELARRAARGGGVVLDLEQAESSAVAEVLAAVNLDRWQELLDRAESNDLTVRVEAVVGAPGEPCRLVIADNPGFEVSVLDGAGYGLGTGAFWVVVDRGGGLWQTACQLVERWPARAALLLAETALFHMGVPPAVRQRRLSAVASETLLEAAGEGS